MLMFKYEEITRYIIKGIENKTLIHGEKLKSLRKTSKQFNCSVSVVLQAYEDLMSKGFIKSIEKSGYFVQIKINNKLPEPQNYNHLLTPLTSKTNNYTEKIIDMAMDKYILPFGAAIPDQSILSTKKIIHSITKKLKNDPNIINCYTPAKGSLELRIELAKHMYKKGVLVNSEDIVITNGCAEALYLAIKSSADIGDTVVIETPVFFSLISILEKLKINVIEIPTNPKTGIDLDLLEIVLKTIFVKAVIFSPTFQNPLCSVMPTENKKRLYNLGNNYNLTLIEDDIYGDCSFYNKDYFPVKSLDFTKRVIYCSSFSKTLAPGLRIGWAIPGNKITLFSEIKQVSSLGGSLITQLAIADYLKAGHYELHLKNFRKNIYNQTTIMKNLIESKLNGLVKVSDPQGGYFLWLEFNDLINSYDLHNKAYQNGIGIVPGPVFSACGKYLNCIRISCGTPITENIKNGLDKLVELILD